MTNEDILEIAEELGGFIWSTVPDEEIITFARRIQAAQKEKDAGICDALRKEWDGTSDRNDDYRIAYKSAAAAIREQT